MTNSRKKIGVVATVPFALKAFMQAHIQMLAKEYDVTIMTMGSEADVQSMLGEHVHFIPLQIERNIALVSDLLALISLIRLFRQQDFELVHSLMPKTGLLAMLAAFFARVPHRLHTFTGQVWSNKTGFIRWGLRFLDKVIVFCATGVLADSISQRDFLIEQGVVGRKKITVLGSGSVCGVDVARFHSNVQLKQKRRAELGVGEEDIVFLYLGRVNHDKGVHDLAHAFIHVNRQFPSTHLLIVGPDEEGMDALLQAMLAPCQSNYHRIGFTDKPEEWMACGDIFCLQSVREGFGSVIIEAAAVGLPAVASRIVGLVDAIEDGDTGILHEVKNSQEIQEAMLLLAKNNALRQTMSAKAKERAKANFNQEGVVNAMRVYYHALLH